MVTQGMEYKVVVQPVVSLEAVPVGGDIEYADEITLTKALEGRREI